MNFFLALVTLCVCISVSFVVADEIDDAFKQYRSKHGKRYKNKDEEKKRMRHYKKNKDAAEKHNERFNTGLSTFQVEVNQFGDMSHEEVLKTHTGYIRPERNSNKMIKNASKKRVPTTSVDGVPASFDWRTSGSVSPVKDQGSCGSCWAFTATGALESHNYIKTQNMVILSEQNLIDCTNNNTMSTSMYLNYGCTGGSTSKAFSFIKDNPGVDTDESYPYEINDLNTCRFDAANVGATDSGFVSIEEGDEVKMKTAVGTIGPVATAIYVSPLLMQYKKGIYNEANCSTAVNHAVLIVGYGTRKNLDFWIVKNSWSDIWGEQGYIRMARGTNKCGIGLWATYPLL